MAESERLKLGKTNSSNVKEEQTELETVNEQNQPRRIKSHASRFLRYKSKPTVNCSSQKFDPSCTREISGEY